MMTESQYNNAPNKPIETSELQSLERVVGQETYALEKKATRIIKVIANQTATTEAQATNLSSGNTWFLSEATNQTIVVRNQATPATTYNAYTASFSLKSYTDDAPQEPGLTLSLTWNVAYTQQGAPIGTWPANGTEVVVEFHNRGEVTGCTLTESHHGLVLPNPNKVELGEIVVRYMSGDTPSLQNGRPVD